MAYSLADIETGDGVPTAFVYAAKGAVDPLTAPIDQALVYLAGRGRITFVAATGTIGTVPEQEVYLLRGIEFVENRVRENVLGARSYTGGTLLMPRVGIIIDGIQLAGNLISIFYLRACWEAAELSAQGFDLDAVVVEDQSLIEKTIEGAITSRWNEGGPAPVDKLVAVDNLLYQFQRPAGQTTRG